jgi:large exoprotein involved in heme utilization and adhesion
LVGWLDRLAQNFVQSRQNRLTTSQLRNNISSDFSASSQFGQQGIISISTLAPDPSQGLTELPTLSPTPPIQPGCSAAAIGNSRFTVTGRGGLPVGPSGILNTDRPLADLGPNTTSSASPGHAQSNDSVPESPSQIVEAHGLITDADGRVTFITHNPETLTSNIPQPPVQCSGNAMTGL